jgi:hypothetical protein
VTDVVVSSAQFNNDLFTKNGQKIAHDFRSLAPLGVTMTKKKPLQPSAGFSEPIGQGLFGRVAMQAYHSTRVIGSVWIRQHGIRVIRRQEGLIAFPQCLFMS